MDFAIGPVEVTTAAKGDFSESWDTKDMVVQVVEKERDCAGGTLKVERGT